MIPPSWHAWARSGCTSRSNRRRGRTQAMWSYKATHAGMQCLCADYLMFLPLSIAAFSNIEAVSMCCFCSALAALACDPPQLAAMGRERVYIDIQSAMRAHVGDADLQLSACRYATHRLLFMLWLGWLTCCSNL